jgi:hypothetical protein
MKKSQNSTNQGFSYNFCLMIEGPGSESWLTDLDPGNPRNIRILWIQIRNTAINSLSCSPMSLKNLNIQKRIYVIFILRHYQAHHQPGLPALRYTGPAEDPQVGTILHSSIFLSNSHRLNMESDFQSLFGIHVQCSCTNWLRPRNPPPPRNWAHLRGRYWSAKIDDISDISLCPLALANPSKCIYLF